MAGDAIVGAIRVIFGADTAALENGLKSAQSKLKDFAKKVSEVATGQALEKNLEKAVEAIVHAFKDAIESADKLGKMAEKVGLPVEELSRLKLAADLADVSMESLSTGLGKLSKAMLEVSRGGGEAAEMAFRSLGISVTDADGKLKSAGDVLVQVANKFDGLEDGAAKTATAMILFGKTGKDLIPLLKQGEDGLDEMMHAAEKMGLVISKDTAAASQKLMDNIKLLDAAKQGLVNTVMAGLLPAFVRLSEEWVETAKKGDAMRAIADSIVQSIKGSVKWFVVQAEAARTVAEALGELWLAIKALPDSFEEANKHINNMNRINEEAASRMKTAGDAVEGYFTQITVGLKNTSGELEDPKISKAIEDIRFKTMLMRHEFDAFSVGTPEALKAAGVSIEQLQQGVGRLTEQQMKLNVANAEFQAAKLTEEFLPPWQSFENQMLRINQAMETGKISTDTYFAASTKAAAALNIAWGTLAETIVGPLAGAFKNLATMNSKYAGVAKAAAIAEALISTYLAANKAMASAAIFGPIASFAAAAAVTAAGLVNVAKIQATQFAQGGSFTVPGGTSFTDNTLVPLNLASGETVEVTPAGDESRGGNVINLTVQGDRISRDQMREMFEAINSGIRDGYRINMAAA